MILFHTDINLQRLILMIKIIVYYEAINISNVMSIVISKELIYNSHIKC